MPIYEYECGICGKHKDEFRKVENRALGDICCGELMTQVLTRCAVIADNTCYRSMATGEMITSRTQHKNHLKNNGLVEIGDQHESHQKQMSEAKKAQEKKEFVALRQEIAARLDNVTK